MCCLSFSIYHRKGQGTSGGMPVLRQKDGVVCSLNCLGQYRACPKLSVYGLHRNLPPVNVKFQNLNPMRRIAFKNKGYTFSPNTRTMITGIFRGGRITAWERTHIPLHQPAPFFTLMLRDKRLTGDGWPK